MNSSDDGTSIPRAVDHELVDLYRSWDRLELEAGSPPIIDFDLATPRVTTPATSRSEVARRIEAVTGRLGDLEPIWRALVTRRLDASRYFLRALAGELLPFSEYINATMGVEPHLFSEDEIARGRAAVNKALSDLTQRHHEGLTLQRQPARRADAITFESGDFHRFQSLFIVRDHDALPRHFAFYREKWLPRLIERVSVPLDDYTINVEFASEDAYWKNWISGNLAGRQIDLRINCHPRHSWYVGAAETLVLHEYCAHAVQMINWHREIERGRLPEFAGILTVHFPDQFILEGLAESIAHWLPDHHTRLEPKSKVLRELHAYTLLVMNNVHIIANQDTPDAALAYGVERLPFTKRETMAAEIRDRVGHPLYRCYQYVYGIAKHAFGRALADLGPRKGWQLMNAVYGGPMTPAQFEDQRSRLHAAS